MDCLAIIIAKPLEYRDAIYGPYTIAISSTLTPMRDLLTLFLHLIVTVARLVGPGGARAMVADLKELYRRHCQLIGLGVCLSTKRCRILLAYC